MHHDQRDDHGETCHDIGEKMQRIRFERAALDFGGRDEIVAIHEVADDHRKHDRADCEPLVLQRLRMNEMVATLENHEACRGQKQHRLEQTRKRFDFSMTERMILVGGLPRFRYREKGDAADTRSRNECRPFGKHRGRARKPAHEDLENRQADRRRKRKRGRPSPSFLKLMDNT